MKNRKIKKLIIPVVAILLTFSVYYIGQLIFINTTNLYALEAGSVEEATELLSEKDLTESGHFETIDFYGSYIPGTSFVLTKDGKTYYDQGYYMVYKGNYKVVYCINPLKTAWSVKNLDDLNDYNNHNYAKLSSEQQERVSKLIIATDAVYNESKDAQDLVAGQLLIWEAVGSTLNSYTDNLQDNMDSINYQVDNLDFSSFAKGGTAGDDNFLYYDTSGQDLIGTTTDPVDPTTDPDPITPDPENPTEGVYINKSSDLEAQKPENGQTVNYKLEIQNLGSQADDIFVQDKIDDPNLVVDRTQVLMINGEASEFTVANLQEGFTLEGVASGDTVTVEYSAVIEVAKEYKGETISNTATACVTDDICDDDISSINNIKTPNIEIKKSIEDATGDNVAEAGEELYFTIEIFNTGETTEDVYVSDTLDEVNISYDLDAPVLINGEDSGHTIRELNKPGILIEEVAPGDKVEVTFSGTVKEDLASTSGTITNTASACPPTTEENNEDDCNDSTGSIYTSGFNVEKTVEDASGDNVADPSEVLTYKINVTNQGSEGEDFTLTDTFESAYLDIDTTQILTITPEKATSPSEATISALENGLIIEDIQPGETVTVEFVATVKSDLNLIGQDVSYSHISNTVEVCNSSECNDDSAVITIDPNKPIIDGGDSSIQKDIKDSNNNGVAEAGETLTYSIIITNGTNIDTTYTVIDKLEDENINYNLNGKLTSNSTTGSFVNPTAPTIEDLTNGIEISVDANSTFEFSYKGTVKDPLENTTSTISYNTIEACSDSGCTDGGGIIDLVKSNNFDVNKVVKDYNDNNVAEAGETLEYTISITNTGNTIGDVTLTDDFPTLYTNIDDILDNPLTISPNTTTVETSTGEISTIGDLETGITIKDVEPGQTIDVSFNVVVDNPLNELDGTYHITNIANICYTTSVSNEECESSNATITTDPNKPIVNPNDGIGVNKHLTDSNGDGILSEGEEVIFDVEIINDSNYENNITLTDPLADPNIVYNMSEQLLITEGNGQFVSPSTVGNLTSGVVIKLPANSTMTVQYHGTVANPLVDNQAIIGYNTVEVCDVEGCVDGGDLLPMEEIPGLEINKDATVDGSAPELVANGDIVHYTIEVVNTGNTELTNVKVTDTADDGLLVSSSNLIVSDEEGNPVETTPKMISSKEFIKSGVIVNSIPIGGKVYIDYDVRVIANIFTDENDFFSNIASACTNGFCDWNYWIVPTNPDKPIIPGDLAVVKSITDDDGNGVAEQGEELTFEILITNNSLTSKDAIITDLLEDPNVEYDLSQKLTISPDTTSTTPSEPTVGDLQNGLHLVVPARSGIKITFTGTVKTEEDFVDTEVEIVNNVTLCDDEIGICTDGGGHIPLPNTNGFALQKDVAINGDNTVSEASPGDMLTYTYKITNTRNTTLSNFTIHDVMDDNILLTPNSQDITISYDNGFHPETTPESPTTDDLFNGGIVVNDTLEPGQSISFTIEGQVSLTANSEENSHLTNTVSVCAPEPVDIRSSSSVIDGNLCASDDAVVTIDTGLPIVDGLSVVKNITDSNEDGIAQEGEDLKFSVYITNSGGDSEVVSLTDSLDDPNIVYDMASQITVTPTTTNITPSPSTLQDLKEGNITVEIPAGQSIVLTYHGNVASPLQVPENSEVKNNFIACTEEGDCTDGGGHIPLPNTAGFSVDKSVAVNGDENLTDVVDGDTLTYKIVVQNNRNSELTNVVVNDKIDDGIIVPSQTLNVTSSTVGNTPVLTPADTTDQLYSEEGITIDKIGVGESITLVYNATVSASSSSDENTHYTNIAVVCTESPTASKSQSITTENGLCASDEAVVTTDPTVPVIDNIGVVKNITDEDKDGIAQQGENLTFSIDVVNSGSEVENITLTDALTDVNVNYDMGQELLISPSTVVSNPINPTVSNLQTGVTLTVEPGQIVNVTFTSPVKNPLQDTSAKEVTNLINACNEDGKCTDGGGHIPLPAGKSFDVTKEVAETRDLDGNINDNTVSGGESLHYTIKIKNTNNRDITNLFVTDIIDDNIIVPTEDLTIESTMDDNPDHGNPSAYTTDDLIDTGITLNSLRVGEEITISFGARVQNDLSLAENQDLTNFSQVCTDATIALSQSKGASYNNGTSLCGNDSAVVTTDATDPVDPTNPEGLGIVKTIVDKNEDGIAQPGEELTFKITISNDYVTNQNLTLTDNLDDVNINYDYNQSLVITPTTTVTQNPANNPTVGDLQTGNFIITVPAESSVTIEFTAKVKGTLVDTSANFVSNNVEACNEDGDCTDGGGHLVLPDKRLFTITKDAVTSSGSEVVSVGDVINYKITIENTGNVNLENILVTDTLDDSLLVNEQPVNIDMANTTQPGFTLANITPNPAYVVKDLMGSGITIDKINKGEKVTLTYSAEVKDIAEQESKDIVNLVSACSPKPASRSIAIEDPITGNLCGSDTAKVTTNPGGINNGKVDVLKEIEDESGNGLAEEGEVLTFNIYVTNTSGVESTYTLTDSLSDTNLNYDLTQGLSISPSIITTPTSPTVGNLQTGIDMTIPADTTVRVSFTATVVSEISEGTDNIINIATVCKNGECTDGGGHIETPLKKSVNIEKNVYSASGDPIEIVTPGTVLYYEISVKNTGNVKTNINIQDDFPTQYLDVDLTQSLDFASKTTEPQNPTVADLISNDGIDVYDVEPGETVTVRFRTSVKNPLNFNGVDYVGDIDNIATTCTLATDKSGKNKEDCDTDTGTITTDSVDPENPEIGLQKEIDDSLGDNDGIAEAGETIKFTFKVVNNDNVSHDYVVTDGLTDINVDYDSVLSDNLEIINGTGIFTGSYTVGDLRTGVEVSIPAGDFIEFQFIADVKNPLVNQYLDLITNEVSVCLKDTTDCENTTGTIDLPKYGRMNIDKFYTTNLTSTDGIDYVDDANQKVDYTIKLENIGNQDMSDFVIQDNLETDFYDYNLTDEIVITTDGLEYKKTDGSRYTIDDLINGITYTEVLEPGKTIIITFSVLTSTNINELLVDGQMIANIAYVCYDNSFTEDTTDSTCDSVGVETPYTKDPIITPPTFDDSFTIDKWIEDESGNDRLEPGEKLTMHIYVVNDKEILTPLTNDAGALTIKITDDMIDTNINYDGALTNSVTITNLTTGEDVTDGTNNAGNTVVIPANPKVSDLDSASGIEVTIEDGEVFELTFDVYANSNFKSLK